MVGRRVPDDAWNELGGAGPRLVFTHANGFPPESYRTLLEPLTARFRVATFANRPLWSSDDPRRLASWRPMADDLRAAVGSRAGEPVVGVGHSLGGTLCALAAAAEPGRFRRLVLLDPVIFSGLHAVSWGWMKRLGLGRRFPLVQGAERRRDRWPDRDSVRAAWTGKGVFSTWDPRVFEDYLDAAVVERADGSIGLRYPKAWEARIFQVCPHDVWSSLRRVAVPVLVVRGGRSDTLLPGAARRMAREMPDARVVELSGASHFLPMERPGEVARLIADFAGGDDGRRPEPEPTP